MYNKEEERLILLAGRYVLGTLHGKARSKFETLSHDNIKIQNYIQQWEHYFYKFDENITPVLPPKHVWSSIIKKIQPDTIKISLWENILLWRSLATSFVIISLFLMFIIFKPFYKDEETLISIIQDSENKPIWLINVSLKQKNIIINTLNKPQQITAKQDFELWLLPKEKVKANPISIGLLPKQGNKKLILTEKLAHLSNKNKIAVSLEPLGGSPNELPSGEILFVAEFVKISEEY